MPQSGGVANGDMPRSLKRRKVRRGTQNCWECKRRKIRCTFAVPSASACDGCKSRGVRCISQQFYEDATDETEAVDAEGQRETAGGAATGRAGSIELRSLKPRVRGSVNAINDAPSSGAGSTGRHDDLYRSMLAAWPSEHDLGVMLSVPVSTSILFHGVVCAPYSSLPVREKASAREILQLPPPDSHPVLLARKLLLLACYLQGIPRGSVKHLGTVGTTYLRTMSRLVAAARQVTGDDDLVSLLEGVECIMIESMYHNNAGNIRRAWITHRRAMVIAQTLGLHRLPSATIRLPVLEAETRGRIDPEHMWYRLIITDRYLSLILSLPQYSTESPFSSPAALKSCTPLEKLERMEATAGGLIIQRNRHGMQDLTKTQEIDKLLQEAASLMPARWWLAPDMAAIAADGSDALDETLRLMNQFTHYHLLAQLHLPYLLRPSRDDRKYDHEKITTVLASREILSRFVSFRGSDTVTAYCRGIDFLAFIASTVLCLAHIDSRRVDGEGALGFLRHQRPSDRGLLEMTLQCMEAMSEGGPPDGDALASKIAHVLGHLLAIETKAADGAYFNTSVDSEPSEPGEPGGPEPRGERQTVEVGEPLRIYIPYFGTIRIEPGIASRAEDPLLDLESPPLVPSSSSQNAGKEPSGPSSLSRGNCQPGDLPVGPDSQALPSQQRTAGDLTADESLTSFHFDFVDLNNAGFHVSGGAPGADDWTLQGVDMALFDSLMRGASRPAVESTPAQEAATTLTKPPVRMVYGDTVYESWLGFP
ncbi:Transcription factor [Coniochaeta hoffmannii]|uniref:Transcription factor n=1 Tax=Coniochaeta hoffmannii TaxID=91930 RepID=A0AA38SCZ3_9PEZI|nr:Transcription factor [Coniochaeta hoffmannii]